MGLHIGMDPSNVTAGTRPSQGRHRLRLLLSWIALVASTIGACSSLGGTDASPTIPLITSKPYVEPEPTPTPEPTKKPLSIEKVILTESVQAGEQAKVVINTATAAECVIEVTYDTGPSEEHAPIVLATRAIHDSRRRIRWLPWERRVPAVTFDGSIPMCKPKGASHGMVEPRGSDEPGAFVYGVRSRLRCPRARAGSPACVWRARTRRGRLRRAR